MDKIKAYTHLLAEERRGPFSLLLDTINTHIPPGFDHQIQYKMPSWVVPLSTYPSGYHCTKDTPLPFVSVANQKNFIALYHMGLYATPDLHEWFVNEYPAHSKYKLDMGKSCIRFKKIDQIPYQLVGQLMEKMTVDQWIRRYEDTIKP